LANVRATLSLFGGLLSGVGVWVCHSCRRAATRLSLGWGTRVFASRARWGDKAARDGLLVPELAVT